MAKGSQRDWIQEQRSKSLFFHAKLHEWRLVEVADAIQTFDGSSVEWDLQALGISEKAWNRAIHSGIAPVRVFAHPVVVQNIPRSVSYYRMLAMVSQKSMKRLQIDTEPYELGLKLPDNETARKIAYHLNTIITQLIESEAKIEPREFDIWRGMAAGTQAQGAWQNQKGSEYEVIVKQLLISRFEPMGIVKKHESDCIVFQNGCKICFGSDPDIRLLHGHELLLAVEVKGGIDPAGAHERLGAALKTLQSCKEQFPECATVLLIRRGTFTKGLEKRLSESMRAITRWFFIEDVLENEPIQNEFLQVFLSEMQKH
ncbi:MAG: hypothetical protein KatS3mg020_0588 [Fimbriimonadales bacterium]|nr:MAG: hypothetical protein KatS3mg020_0588 [Fimbriimonadales bacterium]